MVGHSDHFEAFSGQVACPKTFLLLRAEFYFPPPLPRRRPVSKAFLTMLLVKKLWKLIPFCH